MNFNIVVGNPSYNKDLYIDFAILGHKLSTEYTLMITPAKWQAKKGIKNDEFRKFIAPYISNIVYYPDCGDIFSIGDVGGICYYRVDKYLHSKKNILNRCLTNNSIDGAKAYREIDGALSCYCDSILEKVKNCKKLKLADIDEFNYVITTPPAIGGTKGASSFLFGKTGMCQCLKLGRLYNKESISNLQSCYGVLCSGKSEAEVKYKWSYINSKFIRFLILVGMCTQSTLTEETWRFVPAPESFNHVFTDEELYSKYNLTKEEIRIIESIIKERN